MWERLAQNYDQCEHHIKTYFSIKDRQFIALMSENSEKLCSALGRLLLHCAGTTYDFENLGLAQTFFHK
jgi:hypothetical protein